MKKIIVVSVVVLAVATATISYYFYAGRDSAGYQGQKLSYLGDPKILNRYPEEFVEQNRTRLNTAIDFLKTDSQNVDYWTEVGMVKKTFNNYEGARDAWEYAKIINPDNPIVYFNLGNLYALYLKDNQKAEENYLKAIDLDVISSYAYLGLADFYRDFYKEKFDLVDDVLLDGLVAVPNDPNLNLTLAMYYKAVGNAQGAIKYFKIFLTLPDITGAQQSAIQQEIKALTK